MKTRTSTILALLSALFMSLSFFSSWGVGLAYLSFLPLLFMLEGVDRKRGIFLSWMAGGFFFTILFYWIAVPVLDYGGSYRIPALPGLVIVCFFLGIFWALFASLTYPILSTNRIPLLTIPALWTLVELLRTLLFPPLPLGLVGHTQSQIPLLIQTADLFGSGGITFFVLFINTFLFLFFTHQVTKREVYLLLLVVCFVLGYGLFSLETRTEEEELLTFGIIQSNIPQEEKWDYTFQKRNIKRHLIPTEEMAPEAQLIIWPESAIPVDPYRHPHNWESISQTLQELEVVVFTGILSFQDSILYNSAFLLEDGEPVSRYNKLWLVPFGEYIPFSRYLPWVDTGFHAITSGEEVELFHHQGLTWASPICYEILNSSLMRKMAQDTDFLINLSNEAWFKNTHGLPLLFQVLILRTVELRRPIIKVANTGISGYVNARGEVREQLPPLQYAYHLMTLKKSGGYSLYGKYGNLPLILLLLLILIIPVFSHRLAHKK